MTSVGEFLKKEREARHLSVQEVAELTKISERYLACIESGDYDQLPPGPYAKGYIAAYARQVCGDETQALKLYSGSRAAAQSPGAGPNAERDAPLRAAADVPPPNGNGGPKWQAKVASGLNFARYLRQLLPDQGNLKRIAAGEAKKKPSLGGLIRPLLAHWGKLTSLFVQLPKALLVKGGLFAGILVVCAVVLVLAGYGAYHLFVFPGSSASRPRTPAQVSETPPASDVGAGENLKAAAPPVESNPDAAKLSTPLPQDVPEATQTRPTTTPPHKTRRVVKPDKIAPPVARPITAKTAAESEPIAPPPASPKAAERSVEPLEDGERAADIAPQPAAPATTPQQMDTVAPIADIPVELIKASVCTGIEERMPTGVSEVFPWTTHKIFVWCLLRANDPPAKVRHIYYHAGRKVSDVTLKVGSSHWRTWSFHTLSGQLHIGPWQIDIATMDGRVMRRLHFEIQ